MVAFAAATTGKHTNHAVTDSSATDLRWMGAALALAGRAAAAGEVPVGALIVQHARQIGAGWNRPIGDDDPTSHAEIVAIRDAAQYAGNYRLPEATLYVTLEPCIMCVGAIIQARLQRVVFGAVDPKAGAAGGALSLFDDPHLNHHPLVHGGVLAAQCGELLTRFFQERR